MKNWSLVFFLLLGIQLNAQKFYKGASADTGDPWFTFIAHEVYMGKYEPMGNVEPVYSFEKTGDTWKLYKGRSRAFDDCLYTLTYDKIYTGNSVAPFDCIYTIDYAKGTVFSGQEMNKSKIKYSTADDKFYMGNSKKPADCFISADGMFDVTLVACILEALSK